MESSRSELILVDAKDPILMQSSIQSENDYFLTNLNPAKLIFGCHGSGKTTYCMNIVRLCILCYLGCPIPAKSACIPIFNKFIIKMKKKEQIEGLYSSFGQELIEINNCLESMKAPGEKKLVILDNFCCSSSHIDALAHLRSFLEMMLTSNCTILISSSDYNQMKITKDYPSISCWYMESVQDVHHTNHTYRVKSSSSDMISHHTTNKSLISTKLTDQIVRSVVLHNYEYISSIVDRDDSGQVNEYIEEFNRILKEYYILKTFDPSNEVDLSQVVDMFFRDRVVRTVGIDDNQTDSRPTSIVK